MLTYAFFLLYEKCVLATSSTRHLIIPTFSGLLTYFFSFFYAFREAPQLATSGGLPKSTKKK